MIQILGKQSSNNLFELGLTILLITTFLVCQVNSSGNCPSNNSLFDNCINCADLGNSTYNCTCSNDDFYLVGACIEKGNPCTHTSLPLIFFSGSQFNLWEGFIGPFWYDLIINQIVPTSPFVPPLPVYLNNLNFATMNDDQKSAWVQAYYFYLIYQTEINQLGAQKNLFIKNAVISSDTLINKTYNARWNLINNFFNSQFSTNRTVLNFKQYVMNQAKKFMPCHDCKQNFGLLFVNLPQKFVCNQCPPRCNQCQRISTNLVCTSCIPGFFYNNITKKCDICSVQNCQSCSSVNVCSTCPSHQFLSNNTCSQCITQCASCSQNSEFCIECSNTFFSPVPTLGKCKVCQQIGCSYCTTNSSICAVCQKGYYINGTTCSKCSAHCTVCSSSINCGLCAIGYGVINKACYKCTDPYCASCNGNATICIECTGSFTLNTTTKSCILKPRPARPADIKRQGCAQSYDNNNQYCFRCNELYYQQDVYCKKCSSGCRSCLNSTVCYLCQQGFLLLNKTCVRCPVQCLSCGIVQSVQFCTSCRSGFFLVNNVLCTKIQDGDCLIRNPIKTTLCDVCKPGYASTGRFGCIRCLIDCYWTCNPKNISQCLDTKFQLSKSDYYNYGLQSQGCSLFVNGNCLQAIPGYLLVNTSKSVVAQFNPCFYPCDQCNITTRACIKCVNGFSLRFSRCQADLNCNPNCTSCPQGTERNLTDNTCIRCPSRCQSCLNGICLQCFQGFYIAQNGTCIRCSVRCFDCLDETNCLSCARGYFKPLEIISHTEGNLCLKCSGNCLTCRLQGDICTSCLPFLTLRNTRCIRPFVIQFEYRIDQPYADFVENSTTQKFFFILAFKTSINPNSFYITSIKEGSTIINGFVSVFTPTDANNTFYLLSTSYIPGFSIIAYNVRYNNQTKSCSGSECSPFVELSTGIYIAIIAASICFALLCAVNVYFFAKDCFRKTQKAKITNLANKVDPKLNQTKVTQPEFDTNVKMNLGQVI